MRPRVRLLALTVPIVVVTSGAAAAQPARRPPREAGPPHRPVAMKPGEANAEADAVFVQQMTLHHHTATEVALVAASRAHDPALRRLARRLATDEQADADDLDRALARLPADDRHASTDSMDDPVTVNILGQLERMSAPEFDQLVAGVLLAGQELALQVCTSAAARSGPLQAYAASAVRRREAIVRELRPFDRVAGPGRHAS